MLHKQNRKDATRCDVSVRINEFEKLREDILSKTRHLKCVSKSPTSIHITLVMSEEKCDQEEVKFWLPRWDSDSDVS